MLYINDNDHSVIFLIVLLLSIIWGFFVLIFIKTRRLGLILVGKYVILLPV